MNTKIKYVSLLSIAVVLLSVTLANATVSLQFNGSASPTPLVVNITNTSTVTFSLSLVTTANEVTSGLDYFLFQTGGPGGSNPFSLASTTRTSSDYADPSAPDSSATASTDVKNSTGGNGSDGRLDNTLNPNNEYDLGASVNGSNYTGGTHPVGSFTLNITPGATLGTYTIATGETIGGAGWNDGSGGAHSFDSQASIQIQLVPEPATWSLIALGGMGALGISLLRKRCRS